MRSATSSDVAEHLFTRNITFLESNVRARHASIVLAGIQEGIIIDFSSDWKTVIRTIPTYSSLA
ncbi:hypothetical protein K8I28_09600 [bacterium]|nr:hypothetical protein [bacterium]